MESFSAAVSGLFFILPTPLRGVLVFLFAFAEGLPIIGSILPGGTIALLVGSLSAEGYMSPLIAVALIALGSFLGDMTGFFVGRRLKGTKILQKLVAQEKHQKSWELFDRHLAIVLVFGKLLPVVRSAPSLFAGARNLPVKKYMFWTAVGSLLWAVFGIYGGSLLARVFGPAAIPIILGILVVSALVAVFAKRRKDRRKRQSARLEK